MRVSSRFNKFETNHDMKLNKMDNYLSIILLTILIEHAVHKASCLD